MSKNEEKVPLLVIHQDDHPTTTQESRRNYDRLIGTCFAITSGILFAAHATLIKTFEIDFLKASMARCLLQMVIFGFASCLCGPFVQYSNKNRGHTSFMIIFQAAVSGVMIICSYLVIVNAPLLGDAFAIIYVHPVITLILAFALLGLKPTLWKITFAVILIMGIGLIVKPKFANLDMTTIWAIVIALATGVHNICLHYLRDIDTNLLVFWSGLIGALQCFVIALFVQDQESIEFKILFQAPDVYYLILVALIGSFGAWMSFNAYQTLNPVASAILRSQEILIAYLIQIAYFGHASTAVTLVGAGFVFLSGIMISTENSLLPPPKLYQEIKPV